MKVLIVKTSSLGDLIHTFPALTDASRAISDIRFDWVVEENFIEIPRWHDAVDRVIPVAIRRWRKTPLKSLMSREWRDFKLALQHTDYDYIVDAQGLIKSACIAKMAKGRQRVGLNKQSLKEALARFGYHRTVAVNKHAHAIYRTRQLFADALGYPLLETQPSYQVHITSAFSENLSTNRPYVVLLHGTTRMTKHWSDEHWMHLTSQIAKAGYVVRVPWYGETEKVRAEKMVSMTNGLGELVASSSLSELGIVLKGATGVVTVDTGLGHLSAALGIPTVALYGSTNPSRIGTEGSKTVHLVPHAQCCRFCDRSTCLYGHVPCCLDSITPDQVWAALKALMANSR